MIFKGPDGGDRKTVRGYVTDIITDLSLDWLKRRDPDRPFCLFCHHKAPHRPWESDEKHAHLYLNEEIPEPVTLYDDYANRASAAKAAEMRVGVHMQFPDLKHQINHSLPEEELRKWAYQFYIKDYLRVVASIDDNIGCILDCLDEEDLTDDTIVIYTSDQGFFLGDHGWYDKRFMYEESLRMPFIVRYPKGIEVGSDSSDIILNVDFAPTLLELTGLDPPRDMQGHSFRSVLEGKDPTYRQTSFYYRYWMHKAHHNVYAHYGVRTERYKLIYYYADPLGQMGSIGEREEPEWELFDLKEDPCELNNVYAKPEYSEIAAQMKIELDRLQREVGDVPYEV